MNRTDAIEKIQNKINKCEKTINENKDYIPLVAHCSLKIDDYEDILKIIKNIDSLE